ncbi:MAG: ElyC/SanA/YdcF family protein [Acidimicrobiales bacterium]
MPRRLRIAAVVIALGMVCVGYLTNRWFIHPRLDEPGTADAIFVLGGGGDRVDYAVELARQGVAKEVVFASGFVTEQSVWAARPCNDVRPADVPHDVVFRCAIPEPGTTRGEARLLRDQAEANDWRRVVVVASVDQITRARRLVGRCWDGEVAFTGPAHDQPWPIRAAYEWAAGLKATVLRGC